MSLEQSLATLNESVQTLIRTLTGAAENPVITPIGDTKPVINSVAQPPPQTEPKRGPGRPAKSAEAIGVSYEDIRNSVLLLAEKKGHNAALNMLGRYGAKHAKELPPDKYPEIKRALDEAIATP